MMAFSSTVSLSDIINTSLLLTAVIGIFLTLRQAHQSRKTQNAAFFKDLYSTMFSDPDIREAYYQIEYRRFAYDETFHGSALEPKVDRLLKFADLVCRLYQNKMIGKFEMKAFEYQFLRVYENDQIQKYLKFIKDYSQKVERVEEPFRNYKNWCGKEVVLLQRSATNHRTITR
jgi:hypothetical protein